MKVLYITNIPSPYRVDFFNELGRKCELTVLYESNTASHRNEAWFSKKDLTYKEIVMKGIKFGKGKVLRTEVIKYLKKFKNDLIIVGGYSTATGMLAINYLNLYRISFVLNVDGGIVKSENNFKYKMKKHFISSATSWLSTGDKTDDYLIHYGAKAESIYHYPFSSIYKHEIIREPLSKKQKDKIKKKLGITGDKVVLGVGSFIPRKNYLVLLRNWGEMDSDVTLCLVGGGPEEDEYKRIIFEENLENVLLVPFQEKEALKEYYLCSDIFVHPALEEIWGLVINEALGMGLPIITTENCVAGIEVITNSENGYVVPNNFEAIFNKINILINDEALVTRINYKNIDKAAKFTIEEMAKSHYEISKKLLINLERQSKKS